MSSRDLVVELQQLQKEKDNLMQQNEKMPELLEELRNDFGKRSKRIEQYLDSESISVKDISFYSDQKNELSKKNVEFEETVAQYKKRLGNKLEEYEYEIQRIQDNIKEKEGVDETGPDDSINIS